MGQAPDNDRPSPLTGAEALQIASLGWSVSRGRALDALTGLTPPFSLDHDPHLAFCAYETISSLPEHCNFGLILLGEGPPAPEDLPRYMVLPAGYALAGIAAAKRADLGPHPFAAHFPQSYRRQREALAALLASGHAPESPAFREAPRLMLRCLLRQSAAVDAARVAPLAALYDRPLWRFLEGG